MRLAREKPQQGLDTAHAWEQAGGGPPARHCAAVATLALGHDREAAAMLESVAEEELKAGSKTLASQLLGQAGQAWQLAGDMDRAYAAQTRGLELNPDDTELRIDRALTLADEKKYWEALDDFNLVQAEQPDRPDVLMWMAAAYRRLGVYDLARDLIDRSLSIEPDNPDALLERGILRHLAQDEAGARADWERVVKLAHGTPAGSAAQANLKLIAGGGAHAPGKAPSSP
ncbi:MAG: hypothetical protein IRY94_00600 [Rhodospirillaceae bacterium]|nr:hypothetical protein [Rhodospirillaceae bacterium]